MDQLGDNGGNTYPLTLLNQKKMSNNIFKNMTDEQLALYLKLSVRQRGSMLRTEAIMTELLRRQIKTKQR